MVNGREEGQGWINIYKINSTLFNIINKGERWGPSKQPPNKHLTIFGKYMNFYTPDEQL